MKEGRDLEAVVAALERAAASDPAIKVHSPYFANDRITGSSREHDVGIILNHNQREIVIALECRDRSRNVTVNEVEGFAQKCRDTGIHKGGIVSSKGFTEDAIIKAKHLDISCYSLEEAQNISWLQSSTFDSYSINIKSNSWLLIPHHNPDVKPTNYHIEDTQGVRIEQQQLHAAVKSEIDKRDDVFWRTPGIHHFPYRFIMEGYFLCDDDRGTKHPLKHANVLVEVEVKLTQTPISKMIYRDEVKGVNVIEAGIVPISGNGILGDLLFVSGSNGINVSFRHGKLNQ